MLPPPTSKNTPFSTGSPEMPPRRPYTASRSPSMIRISMPISRRTRSMRSGPLAASRMAAVATAKVRRAPAPRAMALKSRSATSARSIASGPSSVRGIHVADQPQRRPGGGNDVEHPRIVPAVDHDPSRIRSDVDDRHRLRVEGRVLSHGANSSARCGFCVFLHLAPNADSGTGVLPSD